MPFGARRPDREDEIADVRGGVDDAKLDVLREIEPELLQHSTRVGNGAGAIREALVPVGRRAEQSPRVAGAERAHDHVVHLLGVRERDHDGRWAGVEPELERSGTGVGEESLLELRVDPRAGDESGAVSG